MTARTADQIAAHTPTPWFVSGVRFRMNGGEWHSVNRYDEATKRDENVACVGYDPRTGLGLPDAHFMVRAVNSHDALVEALTAAREFIDGQIDVVDGDYGEPAPNRAMSLAQMIDEALGKGGF